MGKEVYGNLALKERVGSDAFSLECQKEATANEITADFHAYLGEYRFKLPTYNYSYSFVKVNSKYHLCDQYRLEPMVDKGQRAITDRKNRNLPSEREEAELIALGKLDEQLCFADSETSFVWASPPGPKEQGYGDYGFIFIGRVEKSEHGQKEIKMTAVRAENPNLKQFNRALSEIAGKTYEYQKAEDFLANPIVLRGISDRIKPALVNFMINNNPKMQKAFENFNKITTSLREEFVQAMLYGSIEERIKLRNTLENYAIDFIDESICNQAENVIYSDKFRIDPWAMIEKYGDRQAPAVGGSCGSSGSESSNILNKLSSINSFLMEDKFGSRVFVCPSCGQENVRPENEMVSHCQHCNSSEVGCE